MRSLKSRLTWALYVLTLRNHHVFAFSWGGNKASGGLANSPPPLSQQDSRLPNVYAVAMSELQELESEPLCHRVAARLLVQNCQLLEGKDDATVLTDSGRQVRDFVDSYAASLAICDLERGNFDIPLDCADFRESALARVTITNSPELHVASKQIDSCLSGLASSDSAWNTWVSYRHKALRFCEAARADNEKAQSVRLYQRLTEILAKLTEGVDLELEKQLSSARERAQEASSSLEELNPRIDRLRANIDSLEQTISGNVLDVVQDSTEALHQGLEDAKALQRLVEILLQTVSDNTAAVAASQEKALESVSKQTDHQVSLMMAALTAAIASSASLQNQMEISSIKATQLADRQDHLEEGMNKLLIMTEDLSVRYTTHTNMLGIAQDKTEQLHETLDMTLTSASSLRQSFSFSSTWTSWWPYLVCPVVSLTMGSYGLPPSGTRNLALVALGEFVGFVVSTAQNFSSGLFYGSEAANLGISLSKEAIHNEDNTTEASHFDTHDLKRRRVARASV